MITVMRFNHQRGWGRGFYSDHFDENQWLKSKTELCKIKQMGFWKRLVYLFKGKI